MHFQGVRLIAKINRAASVNHLLNVRNGALEGLVLLLKRCTPNAWESRVMGGNLSAHRREVVGLANGLLNAWL